MKAPSSLVAVALALASVPTSARPTFVQRLPNGASVQGVRALGHQNPNGGGATNAFGEAFEASSMRWTTELCQADTDGDGATNGEELGDPCCSWQQGGAVSRTTGITHPDIPNAFTPAELTALRCQAPAAHDAATVPSEPTTPLLPPPQTAPPVSSTPATTRAAEKTESPVAARNERTTPATTPASAASTPIGALVCVMIVSAAGFFT